jgi:hypothetical protein
MNAITFNKAGQRPATAEFTLEEVKRYFGLLLLGKLYRAKDITTRQFLPRVTDCVKMRSFAALDIQKITSMSCSRFEALSRCLDFGETVMVPKLDQKTGRPIQGFVHES